MRLIDADALMEHAGRDKLDSRELIMQMIENAPTVNPSCVGRGIRKGHWHKRIFDGYLYCSECLMGIDSREFKNFCPYCGADMR